MKTKILFNKKSIPFILEALGNSINDKGFVVDGKNNYVLDADDKKFKSTKLIGVINKKYITNIFQLNVNADMV
jgi:hypothetical protein